MLTRRGRLVLGLAVALLVVGRIIGVTELFGLAAAGVAVVLVGVARVRAPRLRLSLSTRVMPATISKGELATLELSAENTGSVPTLAGRLRVFPTGPSAGPVIEVPRLVPGERAAVSLRLPTERRGRHEVSGFEAYLDDGLGLCRRRLTSLRPTRYGVRPLTEALPATLPAGEGGTDLETTRSAADRLAGGASLLRPYIPGDDLRLVHWKTTARVDQLMVREGGDRELDNSSGAVVVLSAYAPAGEESFEDAIKAGASLLMAAEREGSFRLVVPGLVDTGEGGGPRHLETVFEALTDVQPGRPVASLPPRPAFEGRVVFLIAAAAAEDLSEHFGTEPAELCPTTAAVVQITCGASPSELVPLARRLLGVHLETGCSLAALWEAGESALAG